jgi:hypothetical protein
VSDNLERIQRIADYGQAIFEIGSYVVIGVAVGGLVLAGAIDLLTYKPKEEGGE